MNTMTIFAPTGIAVVEGLQPPETTLTLYWKHGKLATTHGLYAETKEQLGGILVLEVRDPALKYHFRDSASSGPEPSDESK